MAGAPTPGGRGAWPPNDGVPVSRGRQPVTGGAGHGDEPRAHGRRSRRDQEASMAAESSFDIVSQFDRQELVNAVDQADREIQQRYDLKSTGTSLELGDDALTVMTDSDFTLKQVRDVLIGKMARRQLDTRIFDWGKVEPAAKGTVRQVGKLQQGLNQDLAREV